MNDESAHDLGLAMAGDANAQGRLWRSHRRWVAAIVLAQGVRGTDVEDVLQEVALAFVANVRSLRDAAAFRSWLRTIATYAAGANRSRRERQTRREQSVDDVSDAAAPRVPAAAESAHPLLERVLAALSGMQPEYREPMWLRTVRGLSQQQIADTLGLPVTTVETRLARGRRMLRASFPEFTAGLPARRERRTIVLPDECSQ